MKSLIVSILCVAVFFVGLGTLADGVGAAFKSDEKALALIKAARQAIGGDSVITNVRSLTVAGRTTHTVKINGVERTEQGESELALQLPDKFSRVVKMGGANAAHGDAAHVDKQIIIVGDGGDAAIVRSDGQGDKRVLVRKIEGEAAGEKGTKEVSKVVVRTAHGEKVFKSGDDGLATVDGGHVLIRKVSGAHAAPMRENEMLRTTLSLLLSAPDNMDVTYIYAGEESVDGTACNVVEVKYADTSLKLYLGRDSNLPVMMSYISRQFPRIMRFEKKSGTDIAQDTLIVSEKPAAEQPAEVQVRFSDFRSVDGLRLPFRWAKTVNGSPAESFEVTSYDINPVNISEKFQHQKVMLKTKVGQQ